VCYISIIKYIVNNYYEKGMIFYNDGEWYTRKLCGNISLEELEEWIEQIIQEES